MDMGTSNASVQPIEPEPDHDRLEYAAAGLRERIYVAFVSLAVLLTLSGHDKHVTAGAAAASLVVTAIATVTTAFAADLIAHLAVHASLPDTGQTTRMLAMSVRALVTVIAPLALLGLAALGVWDVSTALVVASLVLAVTLGVVGWLAVRRTPIASWKKLLTFGFLVVLGLVVVALKFLTH
jgi:hypothetical protein